MEDAFRKIFWKKHVSITEHDCLFNRVLQLPDVLPGTAGRAEPILFTAEEARNWILRLYKEWGKPDKLIEWQRTLQADKAKLRMPSASVLASVCESPLAVSEKTSKEE